MDEATLGKIGRHRIAARQIDELIGLARGLCADGSISEADVECLRHWLALQIGVTEHPLLRGLQTRIEAVLTDGIADEDERVEVFETLRAFTGLQSELGEAAKPTSLPLCDPPPDLTFAGLRYCLTGTFLYGPRKDCENALLERGANTGSLTRTTDVLVIGAYATDSWKHSSFGNKILKACEYRESGARIRIVSEHHWTSYL